MKSLGHSPFSYALLISWAITKDSDWETLAQRRMITRFCEFFKAYSGERALKNIHDRLRKPYYLSRVDFVRKIRDRKQRRDIGKYSFVNKTIRNWNQLPVEVLGSFSCKLKILEKDLGKQL